MTVCIAAITKLASDRKGIVLCADWKRGGMMGSSETSLKIRPLSRHWVTMTAGDEAEVNAVVPILRDTFAAADVIDETNIVELIRSALTKRKNAKADELIRGQYGVSYEAFVSSWQEKLPQELYRDAMLYIRDMKIDADFIIAGFQGGYPMVIDTDAFGRVHIREDFSTIGEATYLAQSVLLQREQIEVRELPFTLYTVFEAKKYAESVSSVGKATYISVLESHGHETMIPQATHDWLNAQWAALGPKHLNSLGPMPPTPLDGDPPTQWPGLLSDLMGVNVPATVTPSVDAPIEGEESSAPSEQTGPQTHPIEGHEPF
jgi:20S proteasome alpha/beta subunit